MSNRKTLLPVVIILFTISALSAPIKASSYTDQKNIKTAPPTIALCQPYPLCIKQFEESSISETSKNSTDKSGKRPALLPQPVNLPQDTKSWWEIIFNI